MAKKTKGTEMNFYYMNYGQAPKSYVEDNMKRRKAREREKRVKQNSTIKEDFDLGTETVIEMTNKNKIKKEEEQRKRLKQEERKRKRRKRRIQFVFKTILLLGILIGGILFAMISPIFNIKEIQVNNNKQISSETVISLSELKTEENIFRFNAGKVMDKIKENAYIEKVKIHRKIPNIIKIEIQEREHRYSVEFLGKYAYIDSQGYILEIAEDSKEKVILQGINTSEEQVIVGNRLEEQDLEKLQDVFKIVNAAKEYELDNKITSIDVKDENEYNIFMKEEAKTVHIGNHTNLSNKMLYVNAIIEKEKGKAGEIFANGDLNNKFRVFFSESLNV